MRLILPRALIGCLPRGLRQQRFPLAFRLAVAGRESGSQEGIRGRNRKEDGVAGGCRFSFAGPGGRADGAGALAGLVQSQVRWGVWGSPPGTGYGIGSQNMGCKNPPPPHSSSAVRDLRPLKVL